MRRAWAVSVGAMIVALAALGVALGPRTDVGERIEVSSGGRMATLTPSGLRVTLDGEDRVLVDASSGLRV
jgi:hypothetical protein